MGDLDVIRKLGLRDDLKTSEIARVVNGVFDGKGNLSQPLAYAQIYSDEQGWSESITTTYTLLADASDTTSGLSRLATISLANGRITPYDESLGIWVFYFGISANSGSAGRNVHFALHKNGTKCPEASAEMYFSASGQTGNTSGLGILKLDTSGDYIDVRAKVDTGTITLNINHAQLVAFRIDNPS